MLRTLSVLIVAASFSISGASLADSQPTRISLPKGVVPLHYDLTIKPDAEALTFAGDVAIKLQVEADTNQIELNVIDLKLSTITLDGKPVSPTIVADEKRESVHLTFANKLKPGTHQLGISYTGKINRTSFGLFAADYKNAAGPQRMLITQFEPSDARRFLPSFDEPALKATFKLTSVGPSAMMAVSNMPVEKTEALADGLSKVTFQTSPKMSSYLLFYGLGDFVRKAIRIGKVEVGVITKRGDLDKAEFALDAASKILPYYDDYFGVPYPLPKLDLIAAPMSGGFGAMENWGAVLYAEDAMLRDPKFSTERGRQGVFNVIAHETAHQWFGNLVTMAWWDDLWLNEGFATWMAAKASDHFHPEWNVWAQQESGKQVAISVDSLSSHHPIVMPVHSAAAATESFDRITYQKGQAVIRMLESYAGADTFRAGLQAYMKKYAYSKAVTAQFWKEHELAGSKKMTEIADAFTHEPGVPLLAVKSVTCVNGKSVLDLSIDRFSMEPINTKRPDWSLPVAIKIADQPGITKIVVKGAAKVTAPGCGPAIVNAGQDSYLIAVYAPAAFEMVASAYPKLSLTDQIGILANVRMASSAGLQPVTNSLDLIQVTPLGADPLVWIASLRNFQALDRTIGGDDPRQAKFRAYARKVVEPVLAPIGWDKRPEDSANTIQLRQQLLLLLGRFGSPEIIAEARRRFDAMLVDHESLKGDLRDTVMQIVAYNADASTFDKFTALAQAAPTELERQQILTNLAQVNDPALAAKARDYFLSAAVPLPLAPRLLDIGASEHPESTFAFAKQHWGDIKGRLDALESLKYLPDLASASYNPATIADMKKFVKENLPPEAGKAADRAEGSIKVNAKNRTRNVPEIDKWLDRVGN